MCKKSNVPREFDWNDLRAFLAVVRTGRLTVAALRLGIDHSTLSRRIVGLEEALDVRLFDRLPTGYVLTSAGESLVAEAEHVESLMIRIASQLPEEGARMRGAVRLATPEGFGTYFLARHVREFAEHHPEVTLEMISNPGIVSLTKREADIAVTMSRPEKGPLRARKLLDYEYGLYGSQAYLSRHPAPVERDDIRRHRLIGYIPDLLPTPAHDYLKEIIDDPSVDLQVSNILTQLSATLDGFGLCIVPCFMAAQHPELVRLLPGEVRFTRSYWLVTHSEMRAPARIRAMTTFLLESVETHRALFMPTYAAKAAS
ncbi:LysR family transcriptional regulator [Burkholderia sp. WAC0059]|uniref:LysR family transcriptional regulator n=1 Tax=Burkholderia sp. WAC0059 TaxID=2066022 RepID=UPI000C7E9515|nr:LysR family transcriptional regulator [Burkholderia sp. WAC0059]PLZ01512.1 LysR family transcriptional regulator [Burkholderia sp. WAC0059]